MADEMSMPEDTAPARSGRKRTGKKSKSGGTEAETPQAFVRLRPASGGTYEAEVRIARGSDAAQVAQDEGFTEVPLPEVAHQEYPKWVFHEDGRRKVVSNQEEEDKAEGFGEDPGGEVVDPYEGEVPPAQGDAVMGPTSTRGPVPVDRG